MAIDSDDPDVIVQALQASDSVDARAVDVIVEDGAVVVRGTVATFEEASAALRIAEEHTPNVRNELRVDVNMREGIGDVAPPTDAPRDLQGSTYQVDGDDDLVSDVQESLDESLPWNPPDEPVEVPTRAESRGIADPNAADDDDPEAGVLAESADPTDTSLPDVSADELARAAHPESQQEAG